MEADELLEQCCLDHQAGLPGAEQKLLALWKHLPILSAESEDLGAAWIAFRESVHKIGKPTFRPIVNFTTYIHGRIERAIRSAHREDFRPFGPSTSTVTRHKKKKKKIPCREDAAWHEERATERHNMRVALADAELPQRRRQIVQLLMDGHNKKQVARILEISPKTVTRELAEVRRTVSDAGALTLAV